MIFIYQSISTDYLKSIKGQINIIDIRENYLYKIGHIIGAKNIPYRYLDSFPEKYLEKNQSYYIYCSIGYQSKKLCQKLTGLGYKVVNVTGGYNTYTM